MAVMKRHSREANAHALFFVMLKFFCIDTAAPAYNIARKLAVVRSASVNRISQLCGIYRCDNLFDVCRGYKVVMKSACGITCDDAN